MRAETGSGKTFAFLLPILEAIQAAGGPDAITDQVVGLIIVPTADLVKHPPPSRGRVQLSQTLQLMHSTRGSSGEASVEVRARAVASVGAPRLWCAWQQGTNAP